jgi:hypothetical protein
MKPMFVVLSLTVLAGFLAFVLTPSPVPPQAEPEISASERSDVKPVEQVRTLPAAVTEPVEMKPIGLSSERLRAEKAIIGRDPYARIAVQGDETEVVLPEAFPRSGRFRSSLLTETNGSSFDEYLTGSWRFVDDLPELSDLQFGERRLAGPITLTTES